MTLTSPQAMNTRSSVLQIELSRTGFQPEHGIQPRDVASQLQSIGWLCAAARVTEQPSFPDPRPVERDDWEGLEPQLIRLQMASPLMFAVGPSPLIVDASAALALMVFGLKQIWGLDLELKTRRERLRQQLLVARQRAEQAEASLEESRRQLRIKSESDFEKELSEIGIRLKEESPESAPERPNLPAEDKAHSQIETEQMWPKGASRKVESLRTSRWSGKKATWRLDDDDID